MKKILKCIVYSILGIITFAVLLVLTLPLWIGSIARPVVNKVVPKFTKTGFNIAHLSLNPYTGRFELGGFVLENPQGYSEKVAVSLGNLVFDVAVSTVCDKYVHIEDVTVENLFVSYVKGGENNVDNFTQIKNNVAGTKEKLEEVKENSALANTETGEEVIEETEEAAEELSERKFVIDHLAIKGVKLKYSFITIPIPVDIELKDLGKESGGLTLTELVEEIWQAILKSAGAIGDGMKSLGSSINKGAGQLQEQISNLGGSTSEAAQSVGEGVKKTSEAVKKLFNF
jgi:hypothetical protein